MLIRILEDSPYFKRGIHNVSHELAKELISRGQAVKVSEQAIDKQAHNVLLESKLRDELGKSNEAKE